MFTFTLDNSHINQEFKFVPKVSFNGGEKYGNPIDVKVKCGVGSTIIIVPEILDNTQGLTTYLIISPDDEYVISKNFMSSTPSCKIHEIGITHISNGAQIDYASTDGITLVGTNTV